MASPVAEPLANGISTPPATTAGGANASPPTQTQSSTQPNTQSQPSFTQPTSLAETTGKKPRDARLIHLLLAQMGVHVYSERVPLQLLDFAYRYTSSILSDAQSYEPPQPAHPGGASGGPSKKRKNAEDEGEGVSMNALRTAVAARAQGQFQAWLPKEFMSEVAMERNRVALPRVEREFGVRLPPERYCFTGVGWGVRERWEEEEREGDGEAEAEAEDGMEVDGAGFGGPVGGAGETNGEGDQEMGGMDLGDVDEDEFEDAMGN